MRWFLRHRNRKMLYFKDKVGFVPSGTLPLYISVRENEMTANRLSVFSFACFDFVWSLYCSFACNAANLRAMRQRQVDRIINS